MHVGECVFLVARYTATGSRTQELPAVWQPIRQDLTEDKMANL